MKNYRNNLRRNRYRSGGERNYIRNGNGQKLNTDFSNSSNFRRRNPGKNNQNASKLIDKYTILAKEALSNGDKILYENYFQHADHFTRVLNEQENYKKSRISNQSSEIKKNDEISENKLDKKVESTNEEIINKNVDSTDIKTSVLK